MPVDVVEARVSKGLNVSIDVKGKNVYLRTGEQSPFSIFIDCGEAVYTYMIKPDSIPSQHVRIVDSPTGEGRDKDRLVLIRGMLASMIAGAPFNGNIIENSQGQTIKGKDIEGVCTRIWEGSAIGLEYQVKNISGQTLKLFEEDFWGPEVLAVALGKDILKPGEKTKVYLVKKRSARP